MLSVVLTLPISACAENDDGITMLRQIGRTFAAIGEKASPAVVALKVDTRAPRERSEGRRSRQPGPQGNWRPEPYDRLNDQGIIDTAVVKRRERPMPRRLSQGLGFIVSKDGYILTNHRVVDRATKVMAELADGREFEAEIIGADPATDVAVIKIDAGNLPALELGDADALSVGDWVVGITNSMGAGLTFSVGMVTAKGRSSLGMAAIEDFVQTDVILHPGDGGGPLLDLDGKVVGINTAIIGRDQGLAISLAIPANMAKFAYKQIVETGEVQRGFLGVGMQDITAKIAESLGLETAGGVFVSHVVEGSTAAKAGIKSNDIIERFNGVPVESGQKLLHLVAALKPGTEVEVVVLRSGERQTLTVTLGKRPTAREMTPEED
jgi:serine protease Do